MKKFLFFAALLCGASLAGEATNIKLAPSNRNHTAKMPPEPTCYCGTVCACGGCSYVIALSAEDYGATAAAIAEKNCGAGRGLLQQLNANN